MINFYFWPEQAGRPRGSLYFPGQTRSGVREVVGATHCAWYINRAYISAVPSLMWDAKPDPEGPAYPLQQGRMLGQDKDEFGLTIQRFPLTRKVDAKKMMELGESILAGNVLYQVRSERRLLAFNDAVITMLVFLEGLPEDQQRQFREKNFAGWASNSYNWRSNRSPFGTVAFSLPSYVRWYIEGYALHGPDWFERRGQA